jgi:hypothetical protein
MAEKKSRKDAKKKAKPTQKPTLGDLAPKEKVAVKGGGFGGLIWINPGRKGG